MKSVPSFSKNVTYLLVIYVKLIYSTIIVITTSKQVLGI